MYNMIICMLLLIVAPTTILANSVLKEIITNNFIKNKWVIAIEGRSNVVLYDGINKKNISEIDSGSYIYNDKPYQLDSLCFNNDKSKLFLAINSIVSNEGVLLKHDIQNKSINEIIKTGAIRSLVTSNRGNYLAYLTHTSSSKSMSLHIYDIINNKLSNLIVNNVMRGGSYNTNISFSKDDDVIYYTNNNHKLCSINIITKKISEYIDGYDPVASPSSNIIIFNTSNSKPYYPTLYDTVTNKIDKIKISKIVNATWTPNGKYILLVRNISSIFRWNEFEKEILVMDINTKEVVNILKYEGYENIHIR